MYTNAIEATNYVYDQLAFVHQSYAFNKEMIADQLFDETVEALFAHQELDDETIWLLEKCEWDLNRMDQILENNIATYQLRLQAIVAEYLDTMIDAETLLNIAELQENK